VVYKQLSSVSRVNLVTPASLDPLSVFNPHSTLHGVPRELTWENLTKKVSNIGVPLYWSYPFIDHIAYGMILALTFEKGVAWTKVSRANSCAAIVLCLFGLHYAHTHTHMYIYICICIYVYMYMYTCIYICIYIEIHIYIYIYIYLYIYTYIYICICIHAYIYICIYIHIYLHIHIYMYIHIYIHTYVYAHTQFFWARTHIEQSYCIFLVYIIYTHEHTHTHIYIYTYLYTHIRIYLHPHNIAARELIWSSRIASFWNWSFALAPQQRQYSWWDSTI